MTKEEIIKALNEDLPFLRQSYSVQFIGLFGSYAKDVQTEASDLDLFVSVGEPLAANYFGLWNHLEKKFNKKVDLVRKGNHLREQFVKSIEKEIIYA